MARNGEVSATLVARAIDTLWGEGKLVTVYISEQLQPIAREAEMHRAFEFTCITKGREIRRSPGLHVELGPGDVCLVPPWEPHAWEPMEPGTTCLSVHFLPQFLGEEMIGGVSWLSFFACPADQRPRALDGEMRREILAFAQYLSRGQPTHVWRERRRLPRVKISRQEETLVVYQMMSGGRDLPPAWEDGIRCDLLHIFVTLYRAWGKRHEVVQRPLVRAGDLSVLMPAIALTMLGPDNARRVAVDEAAEACSLSSSYFRRLFERTMGMSFSKFEMRQRLAAAERLLHNSDLTVARIAENCGFTDASHLNRLFNSLHGHTAAQHRKPISDILAGTGGGHSEEGVR